MLNGLKKFLKENKCSFAIKIFNTQDFKTLPKKKIIIVIEKPLNSNVIQDSNLFVFSFKKTFLFIQIHTFIYKKNTSNARFTRQTGIEKKMFDIEKHFEYKFFLKTHSIDMYT